MNGMRWYIFSKDALPEALLYARDPFEAGGIEVENPKFASDELVLGYPSDGMSTISGSPSILILPDYKPAEILAWLKVYAPETSPLTQFARVISQQDFFACEYQTLNAEKDKTFLERWASIVLGEILAQGEGEASIGVLPLSRAQASFSNAVARASICYKSRSWIDKCIHRLESAEIDRRFVSRALNIKDLKPVWDCISVEWDQKKSITTVVDIFEDLNFVVDDLFSRNDAGYRLRDFQSLLSDSVEERVLAFRSFVTRLELEGARNSFGSSLSSSVAMAAFLVGRSTSHVFLLKNIGKELPGVYAWFGLIAGIVGPRYWDLEWTRAAKGIEKGLRGRLNWVEPSSADMSWSEYDWLTKTYRNDSPFSDLPKQLPKVLALEVVPGAICQLRLKQDSNVVVEPKVDSGNNAEELKSLKAVLMEFIGLSERAKNEIVESDVRGDINKNLGEGSVSKVVKRVRRTNGSIKKT